MKKRFFALLSTVVLYELAVAQPLFEVLRKSPEFFVARQSRPIDLILMAFVVSILLPSILLGLEFLASRIRPAWANTIHNILFGLFATLLALQFLNKLGLFPGGIALVLAVAAAIALVFFFVKSTDVQSIFGYFSVLVLIVPALFLSDRSLFQVLHPEEHKSLNTKVGTLAPIVFMIFDEFPLVSLLDANNMIDAKQYPNFAQLQRDSIWFRNATTVSDATPNAITGILTGKYPSENRLPLLKDYPNNLFTMLAGSYDLKVFENASQFCPKYLNVSGTKDQLILERMEKMLLDLSAVYLHIVVPEDMKGNLPPINETWGNFWDSPGDNRVPHGYGGREEQFQRFLSSITTSEKPALYFQHILLPHVPWEYLPDGKFYDYRCFGPMGIEGTSVKEERWINDEWVVQRAYRRHLLQVGYVDRMIGQLVKRLKSQNLYDRSLILITADHGQSFRAGDRTRSITSTNYQDILFVPVFLKLPGQKEGEIVDREFQTIDILPSIADALSISGLFSTDGRSAFRDYPERSKKRFLKAIFTKKEWLEFKEPFTSFRNEAIRRKIELFGNEGLESKPYGGLFAELARTKIEDAMRSDPNDVVFQLRDPEDFEKVDLKSNFIPVFVTGRALFSQIPSQDIPVGIWVNGVFQGITRTFKPNDADFAGWFKTLWLRSSGGKTVLAPEYIRGFGVMVQESAFRQGKNEIQFVNLTKLAGSYLQ